MSRVPAPDYKISVAIAAEFARLLGQYNDLLDAAPVEAASDVFSPETSKRIYERSRELAIAFATSPKSEAKH